MAATKTSVPKKWRGNSFDRTNREPLERLFAAEWAEVNRAHMTLRYMLSDGRGFPVADHEVTDRDRLVASTVVQWLGSQGGQCFIRDVLSKAADQKIQHGTLPANLVERAVSIDKKRCESAPVDLNLASMSADSFAVLKKQVEQEVARRQAAEAEAKLSKFTTWAAKLTREVVDIMVPTHDRTSCSDDDRQNGVRSARADKPWPRCVRCALLDMVHDGGYFESFPLTIRMSVPGSDHL